MKSIQPLKYRQQLYLLTPNEQYLFGRGFINTKVYLSKQKTHECLFVFQQKQKNYSHIKNHKDGHDIIYGTQIVIKHVFSGHFLAIENVQNGPQLVLNKIQNQNCYFELSPQRSFQQNGQIVTINSFFAIQSSHQSYKHLSLSSFIRQQKFQRNSLKKIQKSSKMSGLNTTLNNIITKKESKNEMNTKQTNSALYIEQPFLDSRQQKDSIEESEALQEQYEYQRKNVLDHQFNAQKFHVSMQSINQNSKSYQYSSENSQDQDRIKNQLQQANFDKNNPNQKQDSRDQSFQITKYQSTHKVKNYQFAHRSGKNSIFSHLRYFRSSKEKNLNLSECKLETIQTSFWKVQIKIQQKTLYLKDNDYVQFIYSNKNDGILNINIQTYPFQVRYAVAKGEDEQLFSSFFRVQIYKGHMYLKHILSGLYFPLNQNNQKTEFQIQPVSYQQNNQMPVFIIKFGNKIFQPAKSDLNSVLSFEAYKTDAFWINKVQTYPINEILSFQGVSQKKWIGYFKDYLNRKGKKGQKILKQVQILKYTIQKILPKLKSKRNEESLRLRQQAYKLLFKACLFNSSIKRYLILNHLHQILDQQKKHFINDLIIQLLQKGQGLLDKHITPQVIGTVLSQMLWYSNNSSIKFSISYLRLFRIFCGNDHQPCVRNQNVIFSYFFPKQSIIQFHSSSSITQSHVKLIENKTIFIPEQFKYQILQQTIQKNLNGQKNQIFFFNNSAKKAIDYFTIEQNQKETFYLRQYLYLLSDTMKRDNDQMIKIFTNKYSLNLLIDILIHPKKEYNFLKGPMLSLIQTAFLSKVAKYRFYIFYKKYPKLSYKGRLTSQQMSPNITKLLSYIKCQINSIYNNPHLDKQNLNSTTFKHFLSLIKISIECGFWNDQSELHNTIQWLEKIFLFDDEVTQVNHQNYQQKLEVNNLMNCKILAVQIFTIYVDLTINLFISQLLESPSNKQSIQSKINKFYQTSCNWNLNKLIFKICSTSNAELMKKSLFLFKKLYDIKSIVEEEFKQAQKQLIQQNQSMKQKIQLITLNNNIDACLNSQIQCQKYISAVFDKSTSQKISLTTRKKVIYNQSQNILQNIYGYERPNQQFQILTYKLGLHDKIIQSVTNYLNLRNKQQNSSTKEILTNQLFLLLALIKDNQFLKDKIAKSRHLFIRLLTDQNQLYYIACQILIQIYKNNRKLIANESHNLQKICLQISSTFKRGTGHFQNKLDIHHLINFKIRNTSLLKSGKSQPNKIQAKQQLPYLYLTKIQFLVNKQKAPVKKSVDTQKNYDNLYGRQSQMSSSKRHRKQSMQMTSQIKVINLKDCKLLQLLHVFIKVNGKRIQTNQQIIKKLIFNKENLSLIEQKINLHQTNDNLRDIFKITICNLLQSLDNNSNKQQHNKKTSIQNNIKLPNLLTINPVTCLTKNPLAQLTEKSLINLIMRIGRNNWQFKAVIYKFIWKKIQIISYKQFYSFKQLFRLIQVDVNIFLQFKYLNNIYQDQNLYEKHNFKSIQSSNIVKRQQSNKLYQKRRILNKYYTKEVQQFGGNSFDFIKFIQIFAGKLKNSKDHTVDLINSLLKIVERLFLLRQIFPNQSLQLIKKLPALLQQLILNSKDQSFKQIDLNNLCKIQVNDWTLSQLKDQKYKNCPLICMTEKNILIQKRPLQIKFNRIQQDQQIPGTLVLVLQRQISYQKSLQKKIVLPQKQVLKSFILNLIQVNSSDSTVLSDELKTFFLTYLSNSYLTQTSNQQNINNKFKLDDKSNLHDQSKLANQSKPENNFNQKQDLLIQYQIPLVVCTILEEGFRNRYQLFANMFKLVNRLLDGGNTKGQSKFLSAFKNDHKNAIFQNLSLFINDLIQTLKFYYIYDYTPNSKTQSDQSKYQREVSSKLLCEAFRFLQLLCQNNNRQMKNYVFSQYDENKKVKYLSVNFVHIGIQMFHQIVDIIENNVSLAKKNPNRQFLKQIKVNLFAIPNYILEFLIQVCQIPALQNQIYLCKTDFFKVLQKLQKLSSWNKEILHIKNHNIQLSKLFFVSQSQNILFSYQRKLIILFRSLLQQEDTNIIKIMSQKLTNKHFEYFINESLMHGGLKDIDKLKILLSQSKLNNHLENIVDVLIVKKILNLNHQLNFTGIQREIIQSLQNRIQSININFQQQKLTVYFPSHPLFQLLTQRTKNFFLDRSINFKSRNEKLRDFILSRNVIYQDIENQKSCQNKLMNDKNMNHLYYLSIIISYIIIVLLILFYSVSKAGTVLDVIEMKIISGVGAMQLIVTILYFALWGLNIAPITKEKIKTKQLLENKAVVQKCHQKLKPNQKMPSNTMRIYYNSSVDNLLFIKQVYLQEAASFHAILLLLVSLIAFFIQFRVYSFNLIFLFAKIQLLESILKAIRLTWKQLLVVCLLSVVFSFIFGFLTINNYIVPLYENEEIDIDINRINQHCNSIISCINSLYTQKIIGQSVNQDGNQKQFFSDLVYWGFFQILLTNIIAAIIIDKFAQQRNTKQKIQNQRHNRCYICSADKSILQRKGEDFIQHITTIHYLWNYFYYMYSLEKLKDSTEFTGIQYWLESQIKKGKIQWIPLDQSKRDDFTQQKINFIYNYLKKSPHTQNKHPNSHDFLTKQLKINKNYSIERSQYSDQEFQTKKLIKSKFKEGQHYDKQQIYQVQYENQQNQ